MSSSPAWLTAACLTTLLGASPALASPKAASGKSAEKSKPAEKGADKAKEAPAAKAPEAPARHIKVGVTDAGFEPAEIPVKPNETVVLDITRVTDETCATSIVVPDQNIKQELPLNKEVAVTVKAGPSGRVAFACPMNMITGALVVHE